MKWNKFLKNKITIIVSKGYIIIMFKNRLWKEGTHNKKNTSKNLRA
jgi:hypothetical protein